MAMSPNCCRVERSDRLVPIVTEPSKFVIAVAGDPSRTNAYVFSNDGPHGDYTAKRIRPNSRNRLELRDRLSYENNAPTFAGSASVYGHMPAAGGAERFPVPAGPAFRQA